VGLCVAAILHRPPNPPGVKQRGGDQIQQGIECAACRSAGKFLKGMFYLGLCVNLHAESFNLPPIVQVDAAENRG
jgi:hypothetical protein